MTERKKTLQNFNLKTRDEITAAVAQIESALSFISSLRDGLARSQYRLKEEHDKLVVESDLAGDDE